MAHWLFSVILIINAFCMTMENLIGRTSYRFEVYSVDKCPTNKSEFEEAAIRMNCSRDDKRYLCAPNRNLSNLIEFCTDVRRSLFGPDNCVRLEGTGYLNHYNCKEFSSGCPSMAYFDTEIYKYPACLFINTDLNCFTADINCKERLCNTSTPGMCLNNPKSENSTSKTKTKKSETEKSMKKVIISVVCVLVTIMLWIIGIVLYKKLGKKGNF